MFFCLVVDVVSEVITDNVKLANYNVKYVAHHFLLIDAQISG